MVDILGRQRCDNAGQFKTRRVTEIERRRVIIFQQRGMNSIGYLRAAMAGGDAKQPGRTIQQPVAVVVPKLNALALDDQTRCVLELPVGCEGHPLMFESVRRILHFFASLVAILRDMPDAWSAGPLV